MNKRTIKHKGHNWYVSPEPSTLGDKFVILKRISFQADLKRYGQVATRIDVPKEVIQ